MNADSGLTVVFLLGMVGLAYLLAHFVVEWFQRRFLVVSGLEYILLGALLGPAMTEQGRALSDLDSLAPVIAFAAGWVGLLYGMELKGETILSIPDRSVRLAFVESAITATSVGLLSYGAMRQGWLIPGLPDGDARIAASALGCAAAAGSSGAVDLIAGRYTALQTQLLPMLRRAARMGDLIAICAFGVMLCVYHQAPTRAAQPLGASDWLVVSVVLGVGLGVLFWSFLGNTMDENHRFLAMVGILLFASGAAFFLKISALFVNLLLGVVVVNTRHGTGVYETLERTQGPVRLILLVFAGALWRPVDPLLGVLFSLGYVLLRTGSKSLGGFVATLGTPMRSDVFRGLMAQGDVALAMAISFRLVYSGPAVDLAYTAILAAVVVHELVAPRLLKGLLVDAGELRHDIDTLRPAPSRTAGV